MARDHIGSFFFRDPAITGGKVERENVELSKVRSRAAESLLGQINFVCFARGGEREPFSELTSDSHRMVYSTPCAELENYLPSAFVLSFT